MSEKAVLLANLGSPDAPEVKDVRRYLNQFLMDPYVIQLPWVLRRLIVSLFVLPSRPKYSAHAYASVWDENGSPLVSLSKQLLAALKPQLDMPVAIAMRYGNPSIESELLELAEDPELKEVLFIPLYPHHADSTVTTSVEEVKRVVLKHGLNIRIKLLEPFYQHPDYIKALVSSAQSYLDDGRYDHVLFSYHGLPESHLKVADSTLTHCLQVDDCCHKPSEAHATCYRHQVFRTTECFVELVGLQPGEYSQAFQSRLGRNKWLEPSTENTLKELAAGGVKNLLVICPAFVTDCLETLEEIEMQGQQLFKEAGGESLTLIPCLNSHPDWVNLLASWCKDFNNTLLVNNL
ncbi:MAG: ferrochelatase [Pseudohongiellaceae bacterium]|jgi:ferrochelatase